MWICLVLEFAVDAYVVIWICNFLVLNLVIWICKIRFGFGYMVICLCLCVLDL
jgi:hypothetical protein